MTRSSVSDSVKTYMEGGAQGKVNVGERDRDPHIDTVSSLRPPPTPAPTDPPACAPTCSGSVTTGMFASEDAAWTFESVNLTGQISPSFGPFFRIALTQHCGRKMTPTKRFLGVDKSCAYSKTSSSAVSCKPKMFSVKSADEADLVWEMTLVK